MYLFKLLTENELYGSNAFSQRYINKNMTLMVNCNETLQFILSLFEYVFVSAVYIVLLFIFLDDLATF